MPEDFDRSIPPIRFPGVKVVTTSSANEIIKLNIKYTDKSGFLHIPKTGGTSVMRFMNRSSQFLDQIPIPLFHSWSLPLIQKYFPSMKIHFLIRDPLERIISGYHSRLRMGMPEYCVPWRPEEATAFALFPTIKQFLKSLLSEGDWDKSASHFMLSSLMTMRWNYIHYFGSPEAVRKAESTFGNITTVENGFQFISKLVLDGIILIKPGYAFENIVDLYESKHVSSTKVNDILSEFDEGQIISMKSKMHKEYEIYNELLKYKFT